jgi:hypothetical protein
MPFQRLTKVQKWIDTLTDIYYGIRGWTILNKNGDPKY